MVHHMPDEMVELLAEHCEKLQTVGDLLYNWANQDFNELDQEALDRLNARIKILELWLQSQAQSRITSSTLETQLTKQNAALNEEQSKKPGRK
jgi:hypothetical protein